MAGGPRAGRDGGAQAEAAPDAARPHGRASARWAEPGRERCRHQELAELILEESGYTEMWQKDRSAEAAGRLENLKELVRSMEAFENMAGFLEHVSLVMDASEAGAVRGEGLDHDAPLPPRGSNSTPSSCPAGRKALFPYQRSLDESGRAGLEEERRLAYVGLTRARRRAKVWFASNRRIHGLWQSTMPSRFVDELPEAHVDVVQALSRLWLGRHVRHEPLRHARSPSSVDLCTPGWQRAQAEHGRRLQASTGPRREPADDRRRARGEIDRRRPPTTSSATACFTSKFGYGDVAEVDGNKLTVDFDKAGRKRVVD